MKFKQFIDDIAIGFNFFRNFASIKNIRRKNNLIVNLSKFTSNIKIWNGIVVIDYN